MIKFKSKVWESGSPKIPIRFDGYAEVFTVAYIIYYMLYALCSKNSMLYEYYNYKSCYKQPFFYPRYLHLLKSF